MARLKRKLWCKTNVKRSFGSNYQHKPLRSNWIQMVKDHDEPIEVYVSRKNELETKIFKEALTKGKLSNVGHSDNSKAIAMLDEMLDIKELDELWRI